MIDKVEGTEIKITFVKKTTLKITQSDSGISTAKNPAHVYLSSKIQNKAYVRQGKISILLKIVVSK